MCWPERDRRHGQDSNGEIEKQVMYRTAIEKASAVVLYILRRLELATDISFINGAQLRGTCKAFAG